jgi:hypothetical protein
LGKRREELSISRAAELLEAHEDTVRRHAQRAAEGDQTARFPREAVRQDWSGRWWIQRTEIDRQLQALGGSFRDNL